MALCSAPWYWNRIFTSFMNEIPKRYAKKRSILIAPSTRLKSNGFFSSAMPRNDVNRYGSAMKKRITNPIEISSVQASSFFPSFSSSFACSADHIKDLMPITIMSAKFINPLTKGSFRKAYFFSGIFPIFETIFDFFLTATTYLLGPLIMTPSMTACPPILIFLTDIFTFLTINDLNPFRIFEDVELHQLLDFQILYIFRETQVNCYELHLHPFSLIKNHTLYS